GKHLSDIFQMPLPQLHNDGFHPYEKPLDWVRLLIGDCFSGNSVFDPFLGCGNTALACQQLGKSCVGIDIEPMYIAFLLEQFSKIGIQPVLEVNSVSDL
ncbi:MAG TPA: DNA methyltransferase, partial [Clostridia bacterium]|nr:DNA methyltransferase [Clostridia bacterium]